MKTTAFIIAFCLLASAVVFFPFVKDHFNEGTISISLSESDDELKLTANYPKDQTRKVQSCMDEQLKPSDMSFVNTRIDGDISPGNGMYFYIKTSPGMLKIKFDRRKNSAVAYRQMKQLGEELKAALADN